MLRRSSTLLLLFLAIPSVAQTQELPPPSWRKEFKSVEVTTIKPGDLPGPEESKFPTSLQSNNVLLPAPTKLETLRATAAQISELVVEVVAVVRPAVGLVANPMYVRGHAVWVSSRPDGGEPVLVTNLHWLQDAERIVVLPADKREKGKATQVERRSIKNPEGDLADLIKKGLGIPVTLNSPDKHRNLVVLSAPVDDLPPRTTGMKFFPYEGQSPTRVYGYSAQMNFALVETRFVETPDDEAELVFYLQSTYPAILGAPLVTDDGRLIGMVAMRHPKERGLTLVVPPGALVRYVSGVQGRGVDPSSD